MICPNCKKEIKFLKVLEYRYDYSIDKEEENYEFVLGDSYFCCPSCFHIICDNIQDARKILRDKFIL